MDNSIVTNMQASVFENHVELNKSMKPSSTEKNSGCFYDMIQKANDIQLNKVTSIDKLQKIQEPLGINRTQMSYLRKAEQMALKEYKADFNFSAFRGSTVYGNFSSKRFSSKTMNSCYEIKNEIGKIDIII